MLETAWNEFFNSFRASGLQSLIDIVRAIASRFI